MLKGKHKMDRTLESFPIFPYIAWGVTFFFAYFVYQITVELQETTKQLQTQADSIQQMIEVPEKVEPKTKSSS